MTDKTADIVIAGAARTPMGAFQGELAPLAAPELGGAAIAGAIRNAGLDKAAVDEVIMGCVLPAGVGQAPARQAGFAAGLAEKVPASTLNKVCGSGMKTVMMAHDLVRGSAGMVVAGGMESMTNAPYLSPAMRGGARLGHQTMQDHMFLDGLEDAYDRGRLMGSFAEDCASRYQFSRAAQDEFALRSLERAQRAQADSAFDGEITPVTVTTRKGETLIETDEQPGKARPEKIPHLKPAFAKDGTVTAANASSISDGAAALVVTSRATAEENGLSPRARILGHASHSHAPQLFTTAPVPAATKLMDKLGWSVPMSILGGERGLCRRSHGLHARDRDPGGQGKCEWRGLRAGHPIGASGSRIIVTC